MGAHLINGEFQSDKYPTCPRGKMPLSVKDPVAQPHLWRFAQDWRHIDAELSDDLEEALRLAGYQPPEPREIVANLRNIADYLEAERHLGDAATLRLAADAVAAADRQLAEYDTIIECQRIELEAWRGRSTEVAELADRALNAERQLEEARAVADDAEYGAAVSHDGTRAVLAQLSTYLDVPEFTWAGMRELVAALQRTYDDLEEIECANGRRRLQTRVGQQLAAAEQALTQDRARVVALLDEMAVYEESAHIRLPGLQPSAKTDAVVRASALRAAIQRVQALASPRTEADLSDGRH